MHILLVRFSSLGDIVMTTSFPSWLKYINPKIHVSFITSKEFMPLLTEHKHINEVYGHERERGLKDILKLKKMTAQIHAQKPIDYIIDLHGTTRSFFLKLINPHIPSINIDKRRIERTLLLKTKIDLMKKMSSIHSRNIKDFFGLFTQDKNLLEFIDFNQEQFGNSSLEFSTPSFENKEKNSKTIVIAPVASFAPKRWGIEHFKELIELILSDKELESYEVNNLAGPSDSFCDTLNSIKSDRFRNLQGQTNLRETSQIIASSSILIGNDSGLGHIAESFGVTVISLFGPTSESLGFKPHLKNSVTISKKLWCRPCSPTGKHKCFRKKQYCMETISAAEVFKVLKGKIL